MRRHPAAIALAGVGGILALLLLRPEAPVAFAAGRPPFPKPTTLTADHVAAENNGATVVATGHVVVMYGTLRATSDALRLDRRAGTAVLTGHVTVTDPRGRASGETATLSVAADERITRVVLTGHASVETSSYALLADQIVADREADRLAADGHITLYSSPDIIVTGVHATYDQRTQYAVVRGDSTLRPTIQNKDGRMQGTWMELFRDANRAVIHGPVDAEMNEAQLSGDEATIDLRQAVAVFTGHVRVVRRQGTLVAERVTILYKARRVIAEGPAHMTLHDLEEPATP
jgi:lipopolysaccharide assembly outer membrane protein LptD (OstA)